MTTERLTPCSLEELGSIQATYSRGELRAGHSLLVVRLTGVLGNSHSEFDGFDLAAASTMAGLEAWQPWCAILDLSMIEYAWGDRMQNVLTAPQRWSQSVQPLRNALVGQEIDIAFPYMVVVSSANRAAIQSLVNEQQFGNPEIRLCDTIEQAIDALEELLKNVGTV